MKRPVVLIRRPVLFHTDKADRMLALNCPCGKRKHISTGGEAQHDTAISIRRLIVHFYQSPPTPSSPSAGSLSLCRIGFPHNCFICSAVMGRRQPGENDLFLFWFPQSASHSLRLVNQGLIFLLNVQPGGIITCMLQEKQENSLSKGDVLFVLERLRSKSVPG